MISREDVIQYIRALPPDGIDALIDEARVAEWVYHNPGDDPPYYDLYTVSVVRGNGPSKFKIIGGLSEPTPGVYNSYGEKVRLYEGPDPEHAAALVVASANADGWTVVGTTNRKMRTKRQRGAKT